MGKQFLHPTKQEMTEWDMLSCHMTLLHTLQVVTAVACYQCERVPFNSPLTSIWLQYANVSYFMTSLPYISANFRLYLAVLSLVLNFVTDIGPWPPLWISRCACKIHLFCPKLLSLQTYYICISFERGAFFLSNATIFSYFLAIFFFFFNQYKPTFSSI